MKIYNIMVVDDDPYILKFITANLEARGFRVFKAVDGQQALEVFAQNPIDLVLLDIMMPKIDGYEVCRRIRDSSQVPIIMLSGLDGPQDKVACLDSGADDYLTKPFSLRVLLARIEAVFRRVYQPKLAQKKDQTN
jgi:DNA-binding response OmpR family regulator